jgi:DNA-binding NtrC family response regulator
MAERIHALLVYQQNGPLAELKPLLERHGIRTTRARNCAEAAAVLGRRMPPELVFTDTALADGTWDEVEVLAERMRPPVPVIVVSRNVDITLYLDALERGVSDLIIPPFQDDDLDYVVKGALLHGVVPLRSAAGVMAEVEPNAQNHFGPGARALHAQSGR